MDHVSNHRKLQIIIAKKKKIAITIAKKNYSQHNICDEANNNKILCWTKN